jgi:uncharacterized protein (DUF302 family)
MKHLTQIAGVLLLSATVLTASPAVAVSEAQRPAPIITEYASPGNFTETLRALTVQLNADGWSQVARIDLGKRLEKKGVQVPDGLIILELANCKNVIPLLKDDETRYLSALMPCSLSVYGQKDGRVMVSRLNTGKLGEMVNPQIADVLRATDVRLDETVRKALTGIGTK